jgi:putative hydrolase of the HAD superfamily
MITCKSILLVTDADNTLWDTNSIYAEAQLSLLSDIEEVVGRQCQVPERLAFVRRLDQGLALKHELHLRYPSALLASAVENALRGYPTEQAIDSALRLDHISAVVQRFGRHLDRFEERIRNSTPSLRQGVRDFFCQLDTNTLWLIVATETDSGRCNSVLQHHDLTRNVQDVVSGLKTPMFYGDISARYPATIRFSVGDQLDRDIAPAKHAKFITVYFPGEFIPFWSPSAASVSPDYEISSFAELGSIISSRTSDLLEP